MEEISIYTYIAKIFRILFDLNILYFASHIVFIPGSTVPAPSQTTKARVPKTSEVRDAGNILSGFSPVPAVPQTVSDPSPPPLPLPSPPSPIPAASLPRSGPGKSHLLPPFYNGTPKLTIWPDWLTPTN